MTRPSRNLMCAKPFHPRVVRRVAATVALISPVRSKRLSRSTVRKPSREWPMCSPGEEMEKQYHHFDTQTLKYFVLGHYSFCPYPLNRVQLQSDILTGL